MTETGDCIIGASLNGPCSRLALITVTAYAVQHKHCCDKDHRKYGDTEDYVHPHTGNAGNV